MRAFLQNARKSTLAKMILWFNCAVTMVLHPIIDLVIRIWVSNHFWKSGLVSWQSFDSTLYLFKHEFNVPVVSPEFAAYTSTFFELTCPVFIVLGLATRIAAIPLIFLTLVIEFTYMHSEQHIIWLMFLTLILAKGPSTISIDHWLDKLSQKAPIKY